MSISGGTNLGSGVIGVSINAPQLMALVANLEAIGNDAMAELIDPMAARMAHEGFLSFMLRMHKGDPAVDKHSGRMRAETREEKVSEGVYRTVTYAVSDDGFPYPIVEDRRGGDKAGYGSHAFIQPTIQSVNQLIPELVDEFQSWVLSKLGEGM
jgi:hypothetical protein